MFTATRAAGITLAALTLASGVVLSSAPGAHAEGPATHRTDATAPQGFPTKDAVPGGFASWADLFKVQDQLHQAADKIVAAKGKGFAGVAVSPETRTLKVWWKGQPDATSQAVLDKVGSSVKLSLNRAKHSMAELKAAMKGLEKVPGVSSVSPKVDGSGLNLTHDARVSRQALQRLGVAVNATQTASRIALASRGNDWAPYWGGARWNGCSTGFAVNQGGYTRILSAAHCASQWQSAYDGGGDYMGYVYGDDNANDTLLINARAAGRIYDGGVGVGEFSKPVIGAAASYVGDWVCQSGSYSGATCGIQVKATNVTINVGYLIYGNVMAEQVNHTNMMGNGDSGGPVFSLAWWDYGLTFAKGTNTAIDLGTTVACTGVPAGGGRNCAWRGYYQDVTRALSRYGATITTG